MLPADGAHEWTVVDPAAGGQGEAEASQKPLTQSAPTPTTSPAQSQVLHTAELLESILAVCDDMRAVLLAQRVSRFWRDVIGRSSLLQCLLFFEAVPPFAPDEGLAPEELRASFAINPLLRHYFPHWLQYRAPWHQQYQSRSQQQQSCLSEVGVVHFAARDGGDEGVVEGGESGDGSNDPNEMPVTPLFPPERHEAFTRAGASWRRMLVCQPASLGLGFHLQCYDPDDTAEEITGILTSACEEEEQEEEEKYRGGLRMGLLYDATLQMCRRERGRELRHPSCFKLNWVPPGYDGLWPFRAAQLKYRDSVVGLGVTVFAVLVEEPMPLYISRYRSHGPPIVFAEPSKCEEHIEFEVLR